ncbi:uncharacterized protein LOC116290374 [Actinia tenebrosa]|uniref:Uncharacterized protein LOC116290374 n=1 Tax=Actinia tenebrosa TaxID=6105 RepID=A0A6P8HKN0_ACTTE|nr:uncharacterized protein LOC116290374 [Actinia tenebrosa]
MASVVYREPNYKKPVKSMERTSTSTFESMLKLLLFLETELQLKEELLELLMEDERVNTILNEKLAKLRERNMNDPALALGRDNAFEEGTWSACFDEWRESSSPVERVIASNSLHLGARAAMRCVDLAKLQLHRYKETYCTLQKAALGYRKIKQKLIKEKHRRSQDMTFDSPETLSTLITDLQEKNKMLYEKLTWERNRANKLENQLEELTAVMNRDRRKSGYIVKVLAHEVEQLSQQVRMRNDLTKQDERLPNGFHKSSVGVNESNDDCVSTVDSQC